MAAFVKDPNHWLYRLSPDEWVRAALGELGAAERAFRSRNVRAAHAGVRRAAGMALNGALIVEPNPGWGRSYVDHLSALAREGEAVPAAVRDAARLLAEAPPPGSPLVALRSPAADERLLEAARTVMAHAYARVKRTAPPDDPSAPRGAPP
jgi:HEPN domain-containing protein